MRVLTAETMAAFDRRATEELGVPSLVLMENAALAVVDALVENYPAAASATVFCGPGNNGGDGLAAARHLAVRGLRVEVVLVPGTSRPSPDALAQLAIVRRMGVAIHEVLPDQPVEDLVARAGASDVVIDALYGTGLRRALEGQAADLVQSLNRLDRPRLAVDLPSGLHGSHASVPGPHVEADLTVTFAALKIAHVLWPAAGACGRVAVADLGVRVDLAAGEVGDLHLVVAEELASALPPRRRASHKGDYGHVLLVAGSTAKGGAAALATRGALQSGAGLVTAAVPESVCSLVGLSNLEAMTLPLPVAAGGEIALTAVETVLEAAAVRDVLAIGPGLGDGGEVRELARQVVLRCRRPTVVDADALNAFAGCAERLRERVAATVLTPHVGELARLLGKTTQQIAADRLAALRQAVATTGAYVVLKGHQTLIGTPAGAVFVNSTGNPGMASGGTGDVLTGMVAALLAQGHAPAVACQLAVFLHGLAGDLATRDGDEASAGATSLLAFLPEAFRRLRAA